MSNADQLPYGWSAVPVSLKAFLSTTSAKSTAPFAASSAPEPTSELSTTIRSFAQKELPEQVFNHSLRVYTYGIALVTQHLSHLLTPTFAETLYLTCLLHDLGCTPKNLRATKMSFEWWGALEGLRELRDVGAEKDQAEGVFEAIVRHQDLGETGNITALGAVLQVVTIFDNVGHFAELFAKETIESVTSAHPRKGWSGCFSETIKQEIGSKPWCHSTHIENFAEDVAGNKLMQPY
ncbi:cyanamide hydratase, partial [Trichodelitschia bisporula]